ncbi:MAG: hypothetical protein ACTHJL_13890, partial [Amnibacterium sp.]
PPAPPDPRASADAPRPVVPAPQADAAPAGALPAAQAALRQVVLDHPEELSARDWFTVYPELLPGTWRSVRVVTAHPGLVGPEVLPIPLAPATTRVLVFLVCSAPDTPYRWTLTAGLAPPLADTTGGRCRGFDGRIVAVPRGTDGVILRVRIAPGVHYSVTVYER